MDYWTVEPRWSSWTTWVDLSLWNGLQRITTLASTIFSTRRATTPASPQTTWAPRCSGAIWCGNSALPMWLSGLAQASCKWTLCRASIVWDLRSNGFYRFEAGCPFTFVQGWQYPARWLTALQIIFTFQLYRRCKIHVIDMVVVMFSVSASENKAANYHLHHKFRFFW